MKDFDFDKYCKAMKKFNTEVNPYMVADGTKYHLSPDAPEDIKRSYREALYWVNQKREWQRITGEHFR